MSLRRAGWLLLAVLAPMPALAQDRVVGVRVGDHPSFGRLVFDWPADVPYRVSEEPGRIVVRFGESARFDLDLARRGLRNLRDIEASGDAVTVSVPAGVRPRHFRIQSRVVLDLLDPDADPNAPAASPGSPRPAAASSSAPAPAGGTPARAPAPVSEAAAPAEAPRPNTGTHASPAPARVVTAPAAASPAGVTPPPVPATETSAAPAPRAATGPAASPAQPAAPPPPARPSPPVPAVAATPAPEARPAALPVTSPAAPVAAREPARAVQPPAPGDTPPAVVPTAPASPAAIPLPFPSGTGAAVLAHGGSLIISFDAPAELDQALLRGWFPGAEGLAVEGSRNATTLVLPLEEADRAGVRLTLGSAGWRLERGVAGGPQDGGSVAPDAPASEGARRVLLPMANPGRVVTVREPGGERLILLGLSAGSQPVAFPGPRRPLDGATLLPTRRGVAALVEADDVSMRRVEEGFLLALPRREHTVEDLRLAPPLPRVLDLVDLPLDDLLARRSAALSAAVNAPQQSRGAARLRLAETLLALGLGFEALGVLDTAIEDDPRLIASPRAILLVGAAASLVGRDAEATSALSSPRLDDQPEAILWRGLAAAMSSHRAGILASEEIAAEIAAGAPILYAYPAALRARLIPPAAEALAFGGHQPRAAGLLRDPELRDAPRAALAQALLLDAQDRPEPALAAYGLLTTSRDPLVRSRALERTAELRLATRRDDAGRAARLMESAYMAWRGDEREQRLRLRTAELLREAGQPGAALSLLAETQLLFPGSEDLVRPLFDLNFPGAMEDRTLPLSEALRLAELIGPTAEPAGAAAEAMSALGRRLMAGELPMHAAQVLRIAVARAPGGALGARLSVELADALLAGDRPAEARRALAELPVASAPLDIRGQRIAIEAELLRRSGEMQAAAEVLRQSQTPDPLTLSEMLASRQDWRGASQALLRHVTATVPAAPAPLLPAHQDLLVRVAAFASLAGDEAMLDALRRDFAPRIGTSPQASAFMAMTEASPSRAQGGPSASLSRQQRDLLAVQRLQEQLRAER